MGDISAHFSTREFRCKCGCNQVIVHPALVETLEDIREFAGIPVIISSGFRCRDHNAAAGGSADSAHLRGEAADIFVSGNSDRFKYLEAIFLYGPVRVGLGKDYIHIDIAQDLPREVCWYGWGE